MRALTSQDQNGSGAAPLGIITQWTEKDMDSPGQHISTGKQTEKTVGKRPAQWGIQEPRHLQDEKLAPEERWAWPKEVDTNGCNAQLLLESH